MFDSIHFYCVFPALICSVRIQCNIHNNMKYSREIENYVIYDTPHTVSVFVHCTSVYCLLYVVVPRCCMIVNAFDWWLVWSMLCVWQYVSMLLVCAGVYCVFIIYRHRKEGDPRKRRNFINSFFFISNVITN